LSDVALLAPILYPGASIAPVPILGPHGEMNERQKRLTGKERRPRQARIVFFIKTGPHRSLAGAMRGFPHSRKARLEAEIGVVIGKPARNVPLERAFDVVAGYLCVNDLLARDLGTQPDRQGTAMFMDWSPEMFRRRGADGPVVHAGRLCADPNDMYLKLWVNGVLKQDSNSKNMIHGIAEQITALSHQLTLRPVTSSRPVRRRAWAPTWR